MTKNIHTLLFLLANFIAANLFSQYPQYFSYNIENGLPSNEVYSIAQDKKGFIWIGCDAGLFKFDGVRYIAYKCKTQNSKSISTLSLAETGRIYCVNFQDQIFYLEKDSLRELKHTLHKISHITTDANGLLYATHKNGASVYNPSSSQWKKIKGVDGFTSSVCVNELNEACFLSQHGLVKISDDSPQFIRLPESNGQAASDFSMVCHKKEIWVFKKVSNEYYTVIGTQVIKKSQPNLGRMLQNKKITRVKPLPDDKLWIATYSGMICYDTKKDSAVIFYPDLSFSDMLIDREKNYWFTTLQTGLIRIPELNLKVWDKTNELLKNDKITKLTHDSTYIYFATGNGTIGKLHSLTNELKTFHTGNVADAQSLDYDFADRRLYFNINQHLFFLNGNLLGELPNTISSLKSIQNIHGNYFKLSSWDLNVEGKENYKVTDGWSRELRYDSKKNIVWIASNLGLLKIEYVNQKWEHTTSFLNNTQILSLDFDITNQKLYILAFDGTLYSLGEENLDKLANLPNEAQGNKLKFFNNALYVASNKGVWIFNLSQKTWNNLNSLSGLASDNIQDLVALDGNLWLATGKGLQKIPLIQSVEKSLAKIYLKTDTSNPQLNYGQSLVLYPEASIYNAQGQFEYAYRINKGDWVKLPSTVEQIELQNLPIGNLEIELKAIDHIGRDSENIILLEGYVNPPFWFTWWFILIILLLIGVLLYLIIKKIISNIRHREQEKTQLAHSQLTALKAQMNPHFIFNVLNSIKGYIYENDKKNAALYLSRFSDLIRKVLELSAVPMIKLSKEIEILKLYIELEAMLLDDNFEYEIIIDENIQDDEISIPALLIQPLVENAFKHGLRHKSDAKKLSAIFAANIDNPNGTNLTVIIQDNGIGCEAANKINQQQTHPSFATQALAERIKLLNIEHAKNISLEIIDLKDQIGNATGTKVILNIQMAR